MKVFLGGTCADSTWREHLIPLLSIDYYNPIVEEWNEEAMLAEEAAKENSDYFLFCLTPQYEGLYSFAEVIDASYHFGKQVLFCYLDEDARAWTQEELIALEYVGGIVAQNGGLWINHLEEVADFLNSTGATRRELHSYDFFISYGRKNSSSLALKIFEFLSNEGFNVWLDKLTIPTGVDFLEAIRSGIDKSNRFLYIITPHSVSSIYCNEELEYAISKGKKIIPVFQSIDDSTADCIHPSVAKLNWLYFDSPRKYENSLRELLLTSNRDQVYLKSLTSWTAKAEEWELKNQQDEYLLGNTETIIAKAWCEDSVQEKKDPLPGDLLQKYIAQSHVHNEKRIVRESRRTKALYVLLLGAVVFSFLSIYLGYAAYLEKQFAEQSAIEAKLARDEASANAKDAEEQKKKALISARDAEEQAKIAKENELEATLQRERAEVNKRSALRAKQIAETAAETASKAQIEAEDQRHKAEIERINADAAKNEAERMRSLAEAQNLANQALLSASKNEVNEASINAIGSYILNKRNNGSKFDNLIYSALLSTKEVLTKNNNLAYDGVFTAAIMLENGQLILGDNNGNVSFPSQQSFPGFQKKVFQGNDGVEDLHWNSSASILTLCSFKGILRFFHVDFGETEILLQEIYSEHPGINTYPIKKTSSISAATYLFHANSNIVIQCHQDALHVLDLKTMKNNVFPFHTFSFATKVSWDLLNENIILVGHENGTVSKCTLDGSKLELETFTVPEIASTVTALAAANSNQLFVGTKSGDIFSISISDYNEVQVIGEHAGEVTKLSVFLDNQYLVSTSFDRLVNIFPIGVNGDGKDYISIENEGWTRLISPQHSSMKSDEFFVISTEPNEQRSKLLVYPFAQESFVHTIKEMCQTGEAELMKDVQNTLSELGVKTDGVEF